jgi:enoyl-CoA hydratase/carnithine racemase
MSVEAAIQELRALESSLPSFDGEVRLTIKEDVATLLLDSPNSANALTVKMMRQIGEAVRIVMGDSAIRFLTFEGVGSVFCAGGHLGLVRAGLIETDCGRRMSRAMGEILGELAASDVVSVSVLDGGAIGGGAELAVSTDFRVFGSLGWLRFSQGTLGVAGGWGGVARLASIVPRNVALRLLFRAEVVDASLALKLGIADNVVASAESGVVEFIEELRAVSPSAMKALKQQVVAARRASTDNAEQVRIFATVWGGDEHRSKMSKA